MCLCVCVFVYVCVCVFVCVCVCEIFLQSCPTRPKNFGLGKGLRFKKCFDSLDVGKDQDNTFIWDMPQVDLASFNYNLILHRF